MILSNEEIVVVVLLSCITYYILTHVCGYAKKVLEVFKLLCQNIKTDVANEVKKVEKK